MRILLDQGTPAPVRACFPSDAVSTAYEMGWSTLDNGSLPAAAESSGFDVFITTDQKLRYQQNLTDRRLSIVVLPTTRWQQIREHLDEIRLCASSLQPGEYAN